MPASLRILIKLEVLLRIEPRFTDQHLKTFTLDHVQAPCRLWRYRPTGRFSHQLSAERHRALPKSTRSVPLPVMPTRRRLSNSRIKSKSFWVRCSTDHSSRQPWPVRTWPSPRQRPPSARTAWESSTTVVRRLPTPALEKGAEYISFSTLPPAREISDDRYTKVTPFDAQAEFGQQIRGLHIKGAFYSPGYFMENFQSQIFLAPRRAPDGAWVMAATPLPKTQFPFVDTAGDTSKLVVGNDAPIRGTGDLHPCLKDICAALLYHISLETPPELE